MAATPKPSPRLFANAAPEEPHAPVAIQHPTTASLLERCLEARKPFKRCFAPANGITLPMVLPDVSDRLSGLSHHTSARQVSPLQAPLSELPDAQARGSADLYATSVTACRNAVMSDSICSADRFAGDSPVCSIQSADTGA